MGISVSYFNTHASGAPMAAPRSSPVVRAAIGVIAPVAKAATHSGDIVSLSSSALQSSSLSHIGAALDAPARISNTLATADTALARIGGLLGDVRSGLDADQSRVDTSITSIQRITATTTFGGRPLLDGSFSVSLNGASLSLPSFSTTSLGASTATTATLSSLSSGNVPIPSADSDQIVTTALCQVTSARQQIQAFRKDAIAPAVNAGQAALEDESASPHVQTASVANTTALLLRARTLLEPAQTATIASVQAHSVLDLVR